MAQNIHTDLRDGIAVFTIAREKQLNALDAQTLQELAAALGSLDLGAVRALILTGAGEKAFVAGADIAQMAAMSPIQARELSELAHRLFTSLELLPIPTLAAVNGYALGGGFELALACDLVYASQNARFGFPEVGLGVIPGFGGTQRLTRLVGKQRAKEMIFTGEPVDAMRAKELGLVLDVLPQERLLEHCREVAMRIVSKAPLAVAQAKRVIERGADADLDTGAELEQQAFGVLFGTADQKEGMRAFLEKRRPVFTRR